MSRIWLSSDWHLGHANIIRYSRRPFSSVEEHDRTILDNVNTYVEARDTLFFLGDFAYRNKEATANLRRRIRCKNLFFIEGNHDKAAAQIKDQFAWYGSTYELKTKHKLIGDVRIYMHHCACRVWFGSHKGAYHLYGHSHNSLPEDPNSLSFDVGVDAIAARLSGKPSGKAHAGLRPEDYRPFSLEEVIAVMKTKNFVPIDHHGKDRISSEE